VNAISVEDTWRLRDVFEGFSRHSDVRVAILTAEGRGFNAGIDIKEMQSSGNQISSSPRATRVSPLSLRSITHQFLSSLLSTGTRLGSGLGWWAVATS